MPCFPWEKSTLETPLEEKFFKKPFGEGSQTSLKTTSPQIENCLLKLYLLNDTSTQLPSIILTTEMLNEPEVSNFPPTSLNPPQFSGLPWIQSNRSPLYGKQGARIQAWNTQKKSNYLQPLRNNWHNWQFYLQSTIFSTRQQEGQDCYYIKTSGNTFGH